MARQLKLLSQRTYAIDASSLIDIPYFSDAAAVWEFLVKLIKAGRLQTVPAVMAEVMRYSEPAARVLRSYRGVFVRDDADLLDEYRRIINRYPRLARPLSPRTTGDPWLVALGKVETGVTIISSETPLKGKDRKIPDVCDKEGIPHRNLTEFFKDEKFRR